MPSPPPNQGGGWSFVPYITPSGKCEVLDDLDRLRGKEMKKYAQFEKVIKPAMEKYGPFEVGGGYWESVTGGLYEVRFGRGRIYCSLRSQLIMMYRYVTKFWPKMRPTDRTFCERCRAEADSVDYEGDYEKRSLLYRGICQRRHNGIA